MGSPHTADDRELVSCPPHPRTPHTRSLSLLPPYFSYRLDEFLIYRIRVSVQKRAHFPAKQRNCHHARVRIQQFVTVIDSLLS
jgi:hypothetical protein